MSPPFTCHPVPTALAEIQQRLYLLVYVTCLSSALVQSARATILNQIRPWEAAGWPSTTENVTKWPSMATFDSVLATFFNSGNTFWYKHGSNVADFLFFKSRATAIGNSNISKLVKCCIISTTICYVLHCYVVLLLRVEVQCHLPPPGNCMVDSSTPGYMHHYMHRYIVYICDNLK